MRAGIVSMMFLVACAGDRRRPPLEEVPIDTTPHGSGDVTSAPTPTTPSQSTMPTESVADHAKALISHGDKKGARALLEPRVADGSATTEEKSLLRGICKAARDTRCLAKIK